MDYNTLNYNADRYPSAWKTLTFLTPANQVKFSNNFKARKQNMLVSWDGGKTY